MPKLLIAIPFALAMLVIALMGRTDLIGDVHASALLLVLPLTAVLAMTAMRRGTCC